jgi:hypothetical protein
MKDSIKTIKSKIMMNTAILSVKRINIWLFFLLSELMFLLIIYKVFHIPVTHDETSTVVVAGDFSYWQIMMNPLNDANNHILNTLLVKIFMWIFGAEQWVVRLPNLLSFLVYAFAVFRINKTVLKTSSIFFLPASILFVCNPYFVDFFSLCRGYALASSLCTLSVSYMISGFSNLTNKHIWSAFFLAILSSYANFTLLVFLVAAIAMIWLFFIIQFKTRKINLLKPTIVILIFVFLYAVLIAIPIIKMQALNRFYLGESIGFFNGTIVSLVMQSLNDSASFSSIVYQTISIFTIVLVLGNLLYIFVVFFRLRFSLENFQKPVFVATSIILLTAGVSIFQCKILNTPNLTGRTALFFFPLFIITLITTIGLIPSQKPGILKGIFSFTLSFLLLFQIVDKTSLKYVKEWSFDANTFEILDYINKTCVNKTRTDQKVSLKTHWYFFPSFYFYKYTGKLPFLDLKSYDKSADINTDADYYYIMSTDYNTLASKFEVAYKINDERWLLVNRKLFTQYYGGENIAYINLFDNPSLSASDSNYQRDSIGNSFFILKDEFSPGLFKKYTEMTDAKRIFISASVKVFPLEEVPKNLSLVISREQGHKILECYMSDDSHSFPLKPNYWTTLNVSAVISSDNNDDILKIYLWNSKRKRIRMDDLIVRFNKN